MRESRSELTVQSRESADSTSPILVHSKPVENPTEHLERLVSIAETETPSHDSIGDKLLREAQVLTWGVGGAFGDVVENPVSVLPEAASASVFGAGVRALERAGTRGKVLAGVVGAGMLAKMSYDEWQGERWSEFGGAMSAAWDSKANFYSSVEATKLSVGALAVDMTVGTLAFKASGPLSSRSTSLTSLHKDGLSLTDPSRMLSNVTELSLLGQRAARALGEPSPSLRMTTKIPQTRELIEMGQRSTTALSEAASKSNSSGFYSSAPVWEHTGSLAGNLRVRAQFDSLSGRTSVARNQTASELATGGKRDVPSKQNAKPQESIVDAVIAHPQLLTEALKSKLLTAHEPGEFGYLSAIREVTAVETVPGFVPSRGAYEAIARTLDSYSRLAEPDFAKKYQAVAELVRQHAKTLSE